MVELLLERGVEGELADGPVPARRTKASCITLAYQGSVTVNDVIIPA